MLQQHKKQKLKEYLVKQYAQTLPFFKQSNGEKEEKKHEIEQAAIW